MKKDKKNHSQTEEITMDALARIVQNGFAEVKSEIKSDIQKLEAGQSRLEEITQEIKLATIDIQADLNKKTDKIDHNTLTYRVEKLEKNFA